MIEGSNMPQQRSWVATVLAWLLLLGIVGLTTISLLTSRYGWKIYLEIFSHFQLQYFILSFLGLIALALTRCPRPFLLGLLCTALLGTQLATWYWPPRFILSRGNSNFRILIANVNTQNQQYEEVFTFARETNPDLALFMEVDETWVNQLNRLSSELPYSSHRANPYNLGLALYSRYVLGNTQLQFFGDDGNPSITGNITVNGKTYAFVGTHPLPPAKFSFFHARNRQLDQIGQYLQTIEKPQILMGDLNLTMWSPYYKRLIGQTGLKNARKGFGILPSWPTQGTYSQMPDWAPLLFSIPIDHCLLTPDIEVVNVRVGPNLGSDHRPVMIDLRL